MSKSSSRTPYTEEYRRGFRDGINAEQARRKTDTVGDDEIANEEMHALLETRDGYVRLGMTPDGLVWVRWKWTRGAFVDHYVMTSGRAIADAYFRLVERVRMVEAGKEKAYRDNGYRAHRNGHDR